MANTTTNLDTFRNRAGKAAAKTAGEATPAVTPATAATSRLDKRGKLLPSGKSRLPRKEKKAAAK